MDKTSREENSLTQGIYNTPKESSEEIQPCHFFLGILGCEPWSSV